MKKVLFICTHNSARSQMAEGILRHMAGDLAESYSAGTVATGVNPFAVKVLAETGIDISDQHSKSLEGFLDKGMDFVITVCDGARQVCPVFPAGCRKIHWSIEDPGASPKPDKEMLEAFRRTRDLLTGLIKDFVDRELRDGCRT